MRQTKWRNHELGATSHANIRVNRKEIFNEDNEMFSIKLVQDDVDRYSGG